LRSGFFEGPATVKPPALPVDAYKLDMGKMAETVCPHCKAPAPSSANYCSNCGTRLVIPSTSFSKQIIIYLVSFFLAPFGLFYAWKYLKQKDRKSKIIGITAIVLTVISAAIAVWTVVGMLDWIRQLLTFS
jgi:hypothetical protein